MKENSFALHKNLINFKWANFIGIYVFLFLVLRMLSIMPENSSEMSDSWSTLFYAIDYKTMGIVPRALVGSVCSLFTDYVSQKAVYIIALCATVVLIAAVSLLIHRIVKNQSGSESAVFLFLISIFLLAPDDIHYLFGTDHMGITDLYFIMLTLLAVVFSSHKILRWFIPLICALCMAIYEGYPFAFGAVIGIVLLYMIYKSEKKAAPIIITVLTVLTVAALFLYFYVLFRADYLAAVNFDNAEEAISALSKHTDIEAPHMFGELYFWKSSMSIFFDGRWNVKEVIDGARSTRLTCLPAFIVFFAVSCSLWISSYRNEKNKFLKWIYLFCIISPLASLPLFVFSEQLKYISYNIFTQMILIGFFSSKEKLFLKKSSEIGKFLTDNPLLLFLGWTIVIASRAF